VLYACASKIYFFQGASCKIYVLAKIEFWEHWLCSLIELIKYIKKNYIMLLCNSQHPTHVLEKSVFSWADCKICIAVKFEFWENGFSRFVELSNTNKKHPNYVIIQFTMPSACARKSVFPRNCCKICVAAKFGFDKNGFAGT